MARISRSPVLEEWPRTIGLPRSVFSPPPLVELAWNRERVFDKESVGFTVAASNMYFGVRASGVLVVEVCEDRWLGLDRVSDSHTVPMDFGAGERITYQGNFTAYTGRGLRGFYLRALWLGEKISEMSAKYPPRLKIEMGTQEATKS